MMAQLSTMAINLHNGLTDRQLMRNVDKVEYKRVGNIMMIDAVTENDKPGDYLII